MILETPDGIVLVLRVQPGAGRSVIVGPHGETIKVRVSAPPVDGRANEAVVKLIARELGLRPAQVELMSGHMSRTKRVIVRGSSLDAVHDQLVRYGVPR